MCCISVGKPPNKRPLIRPTCEQEDNIKIDKYDMTLWARINTLRTGSIGKLI